MKILHIIHKIQNRGAETFACQIANHQEKMGHTVRVVSLFGGNASLPYEDKIQVLNNNQSLFSQFFLFNKIKSCIDDFQPDIIQANSGDTLKYATLSKIIYRWTTPLIFRNASEVGRYLNSKFQIQFYSFLYKKVDKVISVSEASKNDIINCFPFLKDRTQVIPVGLEIKENITPVNFSNSFNNHIIHVGGFTFEKNHEGLLRIFDQVLNRRPNTQLHLLGDGPLRPNIEKIVSKKNWNDKVLFHGFVKDPLSYITAGDVLVLPSIIEGLPGVILEAMYCKIPVVAYNVGGISEIVNDRTGRLIPKGEIQKFANAVYKSLETPDSFQLQEAYNMVTKEFMNSVISNKFLMAYREVLVYSRVQDKVNF